MLEAFTDWTGVVAVMGIGLVAGLLGGMLGVGGSIIMIPGLTIVLGQDQHLYQAAGMIANVAVSVPAALRHHRAGAMDGRVLKIMLPAALAFVLIGVALSNLEVFRNPTGELRLRRLLALFLVYVAAVNIRKVLWPKAPTPRPETISIPRAGLVGGIMGMMAGLLGIGGGALAVPLQQMLLKLPLKSCIANSAAVICISAGLGSIYKNATLSVATAGLNPPRTWLDGLTLALLLAPTCWIGGGIGARLTHVLPMRQVRAVFVAIMIAAAWRMAALPWP